MATGIDLDILDLGLGPARGRSAAALSMTVVRKIEESDLAAQAAAPRLGDSPRAVQRLRTAHHSLARLLAEGRSQQETSEITGYDPTRICILNADPAFQELVEYYKGQVEAKFLDVHERLAAVALTASEELHERLLDQPEKFTNQELRQITTDLAGVATGNAKGKPNGAMAAAQVIVRFESPAPAPQIELKAG